MGGYDPDIHHRRSIRLRGYDYTQAGAYFVTICVGQRKCLLGEIINDEMQLSQLGQIASASWAQLAEQYPYVNLDAWVVMPNHLHGIILITNEIGGGSRTAPTIQPKSLGRLIGAFKTVSTRQINRVRETPAAPFWQRNFYEHVIRNETSLRALREYVANNPLQWELDQLHPANPSKW